MDIHVPGKVPLTVKEALVHLTIITAGILIALSLEGTLEWWHHHQLVNDTRERLISELRGNQDSIQTVLKSLTPARQRFIHAIEVADTLETPDGAKEAAALFAEGPSNLSSGMSFAYFDTAAFTTAQVTGALGFMDYEEALKYADVYDLQALYARMQDSAERDLITATMVSTGLLKSPAAAEVKDAQRQLRIAIGGISVMQDIARKLDELYAKALGDSED